MIRLLSISLVAVAIGASPSYQPSNAVSRVRTDLRMLVSMQAGYRASNGTYSTDAAGLLQTRTPAGKLSIVEATKQGWAAIEDIPGLHGATCVISFGVVRKILKTAGGRPTKRGAVVCDGDTR